MNQVKISEDQFRRTFRQGAEALGWVAWSLPDWFYRKAFKSWKEQGDRRGMEWPSPGFPDFVLVRDGRIVFAELKSNAGTVRPEQAAWIERLRECGIEVYVWKPRDWEEIEETLR
jgi:hypothetical protein